MNTKLTPELLRDYFTATTVKLWHKEACMDYAELKVHADGEYPKIMIEELRPHEPDYVKAYREKIFAAITMPQVDKVFTSLSKGRKSADWMIRFDEEKISSKVRKGKSLKDYTETDFPVYSSVTNWAFSVLLKQYGIDANAVCLVMPEVWDIPPSEYYRPKPTIFNSPQVVEFKENDFCILKSDEVKVIVSNNYKSEGAIFYVVTPFVIERWEEYETQKFNKAATFFHGEGVLPCWQLRGVSLKATEHATLWRSRLFPMTPFLKEAVREYSDLQAGVVQHLYMERWEYGAQDCSICNGLGKVTKEGKTIKCPQKDCVGGKVASSPYAKKILRQPKSGEPPVPNPPAGYIEKDVEIIKVQDARIDKHLFKAAAAINMQHIDRIPLAESGVAKSYDREETHNFAHSIFEDLVWNIDQLMYHTNEQLFFLIVPDKTQREEMLPVIPVPEKYDLFTSAMLAEELKTLPDNTSSSIMKFKQIEYAAKTFNYDDKAKNEINLVMNLDPLPGMSIDEKASVKMNRGCTESDYIISCNITPFVKKAIELDPLFNDKKLSEKMAVLEKFAKELITKLEPIEMVGGVDDEGTDDFNRGGNPDNNDDNGDNNRA